MDSDSDISLMFESIGPQHKPIPRRNIAALLSTSFNRRQLPTSDDEKRILKQIEIVWNERVRDNPKLWNGTKFRLEACHYDENREELTISLGITDYRNFIGTNWAPNAPFYEELGITHLNNKHAYMSDPLGVGALVQTQDDCAIFLRRSKHCGEAQCLLDIPGGHPEPQVLVGQATVEQIRPELLSADAVVDEIFGSILKEIQDEVNIPAESLSDPIFIGIARNNTSAGRPSAEFHIRCSLPSQEVKKLYNEGGHPEADESTGIIMMPISQVLRLHEDITVWNDLAPSAKGCVVLYQLAWEHGHLRK